GTSASLIAVPRITRATETRSEPPTSRLAFSRFAPTVRLRHVRRGFRHALCVTGDTREPRPRMAQPEIDERHTAPPPERRDQPKVLVVEDDPDVRAILAVFLGDKAFHVKVADSGHRALELLGEEPVDLILSDVRMPGMSGMELLRTVKERDPEIELVLMSAYSCVRDAVEAIQLGAADYVEKPIDFRRLERVLQTVLEKRNLVHRTKILEQRLQGVVTFEGMVARTQR